MENFVLELMSEHLHKFRVGHLAARMCDGMTMVMMYNEYKVAEHRHAP
jgi:hypothetical protein